MPLHPKVRAPLSPSCHRCHPSPSRGSGSLALHLWLPRVGRRASHRHQDPRLPSAWFPREIFHHFTPKASSAERSGLEGQQCLPTFYACWPRCLGLANILRTVTEPLPASTGTRTARLGPHSHPNKQPRRRIPNTETSSSPSRLPYLCIDRQH